MNLPAVPEFLRIKLSRLPHYPASAAFATLLTLQLGEHVNAAMLPALAEKKIKLRIRDMGVVLMLQVGTDGIFACRSGTADLTLIATARDFLSLALRREDPDTLFFSRRLVMEGDTELGVFLKNTLDGLPARGFMLPAPTRLLSALRLQLRSLGAPRAQFTASGDLCSEQPRNKSTTTPDRTTAADREQAQRQ